jgi:hypothetical protein
VEIGEKFQERHDRRRSDGLDSRRGISRRRQIAEVEIAAWLRQNGASGFVAGCSFQDPGDRR